MAGVFSLEDAVALVAVRGRLMGSLPVGGAMLAVEAGEREVREGLDGRLAVAAVNGPRAVVVSGGVEAIEEAERVWRERGRKVTRLRVSHAFHSQLMDPVLDELRGVAEGLGFSEPGISVVSNVTGELLSAGEATSAAYWVGHVRETVRFADGVGALERAGVTRFVELGPDGSLGALAGQCLGAEGEALVTASMRRGRDELLGLVGCLVDAHVGGVGVDWGVLFEGGGVGRVALPTYAFQRERFWLRGGGVGDVSTLGLFATEHPLLGATLEFAGDQEGVVFTGRWSCADQPWLSEHAVMGQVLFPGTGFLELAFAAAGRVGVEVIDELALQAPLFLGVDEAVQIQLVLSAVDEGGRRELSIYSRLERASGDGVVGEAWVLHAVGVLGVGEADVSVELAGFARASWPPEGAEELDTELLYDRLAGVGYDYGPSFQGVRGWVVGRELYAEVALGSEQEGETHRFGVHPALLDSAFHVGLLGGGSSRVICRSS